MNHPGKGDPYAVELSDTTHKCVPQIRTLWRDSPADAIDGARRWFRLHRRIRNGLPKCDRVRVWRGTQVRRGTPIFEGGPDSVEG